jgi:hypothetical protein
MLQISNEIQAEDKDVQLQYIVKKRKNYKYPIFNKKNNRTVMLDHMHSKIREEQRLT